MSIIIAPSVLAADINHLGDQVQEVVSAGADWIHVDVMDGSFVPNISFGPNIVKAVRKITSLPIDVHLMIETPERHLQAFAEAGTNHITVHYETCPHIHRTMQRIREMGMSPGIVINPGTPVGMLRELTRDFEKILIMTVNPGFGGQAFIESMLDKIHRTKTLLQETGSSAQIQVDGGINKDTIKPCYEVGATNFVVGTSIFKYKDGIAAGIQALRGALQQAP
ncbi:MAG: ribulose-phosphate 3-epimerase [Chloroflexota bacterium]|jgi:ribulose-phosphate 3-epimerase|nr:ribulose-phosphate 3-epimerase [Chloroflexota bacterium]